MNYVSSADQKQRFARICHTCMTRWARVDKTYIAAKTCLQCWTSAAPFLLLSLFDAPFHNAPRPTYVCICIIHWFANAWPVWTLMWTHWTYFNIRLCCIGCQWPVCSKLWKASFDFSHFDPEPVLTVSYHAVPRLCHVINRYHEHAQCFVSPLHDQPIAWSAHCMTSQCKKPLSAMQRPRRLQGKQSRCTLPYEASTGTTGINSSKGSNITCSTCSSTPECSCIDISLDTTEREGCLQVNSAYDTKGIVAVQQFYSYLKMV